MENYRKSIFQSFKESYTSNRKSNMEIKSTKWKGAGINLYNTSMSQQSDIQWCSKTWHQLNSPFGKFRSFIQYRRHLAEKTTETVDIAHHESEGNNHYFYCHSTFIKCAEMGEESSKRATEISRIDWNISFVSCLTTAGRITFSAAHVPMLPRNMSLVSFYWK